MLYLAKKPAPDAGRKVVVQEHEQKLLTFWGQRSELKSSLLRADMAKQLGIK